MTAPSRATQSVARYEAVTDDARRCCRVTAAKSLREKDPADPGSLRTLVPLAGEEQAGLPGSGGAT